jgi:hypothetical protein
MKTKGKDKKLWQAKHPSEAKERKKITEGNKETKKQN